MILVGFLAGIQITTASRWAFAPGEKVGKNKFQLSHEFPTLVGWAI